MNRSYLQGTPWHEEQMKRTCKEGSTYCVYNRNKICVCTASIFHGKSCVGKGECEMFESRNGTPKVVGEKTIIVKQNPQNSKMMQSGDRPSLQTLKIKQYEYEEEEAMDEMVNATNQTEFDDDHETPEERFTRVSLNRIKAVTEDLRKISNLSNKSRYAYTPEQVDKMFRHIMKAVETARESFEEKDFMEEFSWGDE